MWYGDGLGLRNSPKDIPAIWVYDMMEHRHEINQWVQETNERRRELRSIAQRLGDEISNE